MDRVVGELGNYLGFRDHKKYVGGIPLSDFGVPVGEKVRFPPRGGLHKGTIERQIPPETGHSWRSQYGLWPSMAWEERIF